MSQSKETKAFGVVWRRVWQEDECTPGTDGHRDLTKAWQERYKEPAPLLANVQQREDWGDVFPYRIDENRMVIVAFDGTSIWERA